MSVDGAKLTGWKYDEPNSYLEVWIRGTNVARFDDATADLTLITNGLTVDSGGITITGGVLAQSSATNSTTTTDGSIQTDGGFGIAGAVFIGGSLEIVDKITYDDQIFSATQITETATGPKALDAQDVGKIMQADTDDTVYTLPATSAGLVFTIVNTCDSGQCKVSFSPHSNDQIIGLDESGTEHKDLINTKTSSKKGDMCTLIGDGSAGWFIKQIHGTWAQEI